MPDLCKFDTTVFSRYGRIMPPNNLPTTVSVVVPSPTPTSNNQVTTEPSKHFPVKLVVIIALILLLFGTLGAGYIFVPKIFSDRFATQLKPKVKSLKSSVTNVKGSISKIYYLAVDQTSSTPPEGVKTTGLLIHPNLAALLVDTNVLGVSTDSNKAIIEQKAVQWSKQLKGVNDISTAKDANVLGSNTTYLDNVVRGIKDQSLKTHQEIDQANSDLSNLKSVIQKPPVLITPNMKDKVVSNNGLDKNINPYLNEAGKISNYYNTISDTILTMNIKIQSFKNSLSLVSSTMSSTGSQDTQTKLKQAQVNLDQAKKDADGVKQLIATLTNIPADQLPASSQDFHKHNIKVLDTVNTYFNSESKYMQQLLDTTNSFINQSPGKSINTLEFLQFRQQVQTITSAASVEETKFASDLLSLIGEESSLTKTFWQNNGILSKGDAAVTGITNLERSLDSP